MTTGQPISAPAKTGFWWKCRRVVRWCRITLLSALLLAMGGLIYLNSSGVPEFMRERLREELLAHGLDAQFSRLRLKWYHGLVADDLQLRQAGRHDSPVITMDEASIRLDNAALRRFEFHVESLIIRQGRCSLPLGSKDQPYSSFDIEGIRAELRLLPNDQWELDEFEAECLGAKLSLTGTLTNASALGKGLKVESTNELRGAWKAQLKQVRRIADQFRFETKPEIRLALTGDGRQPAAFRSRLSLTSGRAQSPWLNADHLLLVAVFRPSATNPLAIHSEINLGFTNASSRWVSSRDGQLNLETEQPLTNDWPHSIRWHLDLNDTAFANSQERGSPDPQTTARAGLTTRAPAARALRASLSGTSLRQAGENQVFDSSLQGTLQAVAIGSVATRLTKLEATLTHTVTNFLRASGHARVQATDILAPWGGAGGLDVNVAFTPASPPSPVGVEVTRPQPPQSGSSRGDETLTQSGRSRGDETLTQAPAGAWGPWTNALPFRLDWQASAQELKWRDALLRNLEASGLWEAPRLWLRKLEARLDETHLDISGDLAVPTRQVSLQIATTLDPQTVTRFLGTNSPAWVRELAFTSAPEISGQARFVLAPWTNSAPDWKGEVLPSLVLDGHFTAPGISWREVALGRVETGFGLSNGVWRLPDLAVRLDTGSLAVALELDTATRRFTAQLDSRFDPKMLQPAFGTGPQVKKAFDLFQFTSPPHVAGRLTGSLTNFDAFNFQGRVDITNAVFRGESVGQFSAEVGYADRRITGNQALILSGGGTGRVQQAAFDFRTELVHITNAVCNLDPMTVARAIGPKTAQAIEPYRFKAPPNITVNGRLHVRGMSHDLRFGVAGQDFNWWRFNLSPVTAEVHWLDETVTIANLQAGFYRGKAQTDLFFDFSQNRERAQPEGLPESSRSVESARPPENRRENPPHPGGVPETKAPTIH